jgi:hypothetical protein
MISNDPFIGLILIVLGVWLFFDRVAQSIKRNDPEIL